MIRPFSPAIGSILIVVAAAIFLPGCATPPYKTYSGPVLQKESVAVIRCHYSVGQGFILVITCCDGVVYSHSSENTEGGIALLPGKHNVTFTAWAPFPVGFEVIGTCNEECEVSAGRKYTATGTMIQPALAYPTSLAPGLLSVEVADPDEKPNLSPPQGMGGLYVVRPGGLVGAAVPWEVYIDGSDVGGLGNGRFFYRELLPGTHTLGFKGESNLSVEAGNNYFFVMKAGFASPKLSRMSEVEGKRLVMKLRKDNGHHEAKPAVLSMPQAN